MVRALRGVKSPAQVRPVALPGEVEASSERVPCLPGSGQPLEGVAVGRVSAAAGRAAYEFLCTAIDLTLRGEADGIVTLPLHKEGLHAAGVPHPGHTEILAERTGTDRFAMMLYARGGQVPHGLGVVHVTLHMAFRDVLRHLSEAAVREKIHLLDRPLTLLLDRRPRIGVAALNPHASDGGLFGDEEATLIRPAVEHARREGIDVSGPWPSDTLFVRAHRREFDGVVAMYHDQGHIPLKLLTGLAAVNVTLGLPIVRTSVAHGTAYDIAGRGVADASSLVEAVRVAAKLAIGKAGGGQIPGERGASAPCWVE
jgi:4-hydroxythreonine-4-phosphate dehydrogenase